MISLTLLRVLDILLLHIQLVFFKVLLCYPVPRSCLDYDSSLTNKETVMLVEETVLLIAFAVTEIKRLVFIESITDSIKVQV